MNELKPSHRPSSTAASGRCSQQLLPMNPYEENQSPQQNLHALCPLLVLAASLSPLCIEPPRPAHRAGSCRHIPASIRQER